MYVLLLTACLNPDGMSFTKVTDPEIRKEQYVTALRFYLKHTHYPVVFCENSGNDLSPVFPEEISSGRLEVLTFAGNKHKEKGKGFGECEIIGHALQHSQIIRQCLGQSKVTHTDLLVVKITGRLIIKNIEDIIKKRLPLQKDEELVCKMDTFSMFASSEVFIASLGLLNAIVDNKERLNDNKGFWFEHLLAKLAMEMQCHYFPFYTEPLVQGISGSEGKSYRARQRTTREKWEYRYTSLHNTVMYYHKVVPNRYTYILKILYKAMAFFYLLCLKAYLSFH